MSSGSKKLSDNNGIFKNNLITYDAHTKEN